MNTVTVANIMTVMEEWAPSAWAYEWDSVGLQLGTPNQPVSSVLVCLSVTETVAAKANLMPQCMVIAHHPLIWKPLKALRTDNSQTRLCLELARAGTACFVAHTNLDLAPGGVNDALAQAINLMETRPLFNAPHLEQVKLVTFVPADAMEHVRDALASAGAGVIGEYTHCSFYAPGTGTFLPGTNATPFVGHKGMVNAEPELRLEMLVDKSRLGRALDAMRNAHPYEEPAYDIVHLLNRNTELGLGARGILGAPMSLKAFAEHVRRSLRMPNIKVWGTLNRTVNRIAVLGGSGGSSITNLPDDIDVIVTGDIGYHDAQTALQRNIACIDADHAGTEVPVLNHISRRLRNHFKELRVKVYRETPAFRVL